MPAGPGDARALHIRPFDYRSMADSEGLALAEHIVRMGREAMPDDPTVPPADLLAVMRAAPKSFTPLAWAAWTAADHRIVAYGQASFQEGDPAERALTVVVDVEPEFRRQGVGRSLLTLVAQSASERRRSRMAFETFGSVPAGALFAAWIGAERGEESHVNQLVLADVDRDALRAWAAPAPGFALSLQEGACPADALPDVAALMEVVGQPLTPEGVREVERGELAAGGERWTFFARETATGRIAGFTQTLWKPGRPDLVNQGPTAVFPEFRNRGLGRWLKAAMLEKIVAERPEARIVRATNADANAAMRRINETLGFRPYRSRTVWKAETERVLARLKSAG